MNNVALLLEETGLPYELVLPRGECDKLGMRHMQRLGRAREIALLRNREKVANMT